MVIVQRFIKFLALFAVFYFLFFIVALYFLSDAYLQTGFNHFFIQHFQIKQLLIIVLFSAIYPFVGFTKVKFYMNGDWDSNKDWILAVIANCGFEQIPNTVNSFRKKNVFVRAINLGEDILNINTSDNPIIISGMRKELKKLKQQLDFEKRLK